MTGDGVPEEHGQAGFLLWLTKISMPPVPLTVSVLLDVASQDTHAIAQASAGRAGLERYALTSEHARLVRNYISLS